VIDRHRFEQAQRRAQLVVDRCGCVVVQNLPRQTIVAEGGSRDRGMGIRSKATPVQSRYERREQLAFGD
jgi:hypothetical protein